MAQVYENFIFPTSIISFHVRFYYTSNTSLSNCLKNSIHPNLPSETWCGQALNLIFSMDILIFYSKNRILKSMLYPFSMCVQRLRDMTKREKGMLF